MLQMLLVNNFEWIKDTSKFNEDFIKNYNEESDERFFLEIDVEYPEILQKLHNDLLLLLERMKIEKVKKFLANLDEKIEYVMHIKNWKQGLNHGLVLKKVQRVIEFNQNVLLNPYTDKNTGLSKNTKNHFDN